MAGNFFAAVNDTFRFVIIVPIVVSKPIVMQMVAFTIWTDQNLPWIPIASVTGQEPKPTLFVETIEQAVVVRCHRVTGDMSPILPEAVVKIKGAAGNRTSGLYAMSIVCTNTSVPTAPGLSIVERLRGEQEAINPPGLRTGLRPPTTTGSFLSM